MPGVYHNAKALKVSVGNTLNNYWSKTKRTYIGFSDERIYCPTREELDALLDRYVVPAVGDPPESFDCDDYAFVLKGFISLAARQLFQLETSMCIGIVWAVFDWIDVPLHAANWAVLNDGKLVWIEPQTKQEYSLSDCRGGLELLLV